MGKGVPFSCIQPGANFYGRVMKPVDLIFLMETSLANHNYGYASGFHKKHLEFEQHGAGMPRHRSLPLIVLTIER